MARILIGVTGGIAAYKALELTRLAIKAGHAVRVVQTPNAARFVGAASFAGITGAPVLTTEWEDDPLRGAFPGDPVPAHAPIGHLELVGRADVFAIAPASANTIAKLANGHADNLLTAAALARSTARPLIVAPAMNAAMYEHPATQANLARLRERGVTVLEPGSGSLASLGEEGIGRLPEPPELLAAIERALQHSRALDGLNVLVTAGGTREPIDAVRYVGNRSSGRMGFALAEAAAARGATVTVIAANVGLPRRAGIAYVDVTTAAELADAAREHFARADVLLMAAAVADYRPADPHGGKLKKDAAGELNLQLVRTTDVLSALADARRPGQVLIGFAAEHGDGALAYARGKLVRKGLDAVVLNDVSDPGIGFDSAENEVVIATADGERHVPRASKDEVAGAILDMLLSDRSSQPVKVPR
ncbi:MAG TPA: bifunctional phosphopantothenoylcysteine decarboxylase/phosphopantothenate--cysteine ligase CoaBC [Solirubrobacteraceae bacterium]|nr:bifunctional phosphopantothenoylcysteine decarboxylase/phosphopantothenate--cysteine ligase CoaBC [Solirubrobacteraceae bacterium]